MEHPAVRYFGAFVAGELVGVFVMIESGFVEVDVHALLKPRTRHSRTLGRLFLAHVFSDPAIQRATAYVIDGLDVAVNYCRRLGFVYEGARRDACQVRGQLRPVHTLGLTRRDWSAA